MSAQSESVAEQDDGAHRLSVRYRRERQRYRLSATAGYFAETLDYRDSLAGVDSESDFTVALADLSVTLPLRHHQTVLVGGTGRHTRARVDDAYEGTPDETSVSALASYAITWRGLDLQASARYGYAGALSLGFTPSLGVSYRATPALTVRGRVSRDYRVPTFNDRYYRPGGNPDLRPESGYSTEIGVDFERGGFTASVTGFRREISDWILWARQPDRPFFSAYNLAAVTTTGLEPRVGYAREFGERSRLMVAAGYDLIRAINRRAVGLPRIAEGEQLWYVPRHSGFATLSAAVGDLALRYTHRWRGENVGINDVIDASNAGDLQVQVDAPWRAHALMSFVEVRNLWDADYLLIERRPLPGRHLRAGLRLTY